MIPRIQCPPLVLSIVGILGCNAEPSGDNTPYGPPGPNTSAGNPSGGTDEGGLESDGAISDDDGDGESRGPGDDGVDSGPGPGDGSGADPSGGDPSGGDETGNPPDGPDYGDCGWLGSEGWYACGGVGEDPANPIACPPGLVEGGACGSVTTVGCCENGGKNWWCGQNGSLSSEECGGADPSGGEVDDGDPTGADPGQPGTPASNISIARIDANQAVNITVMQNGNLVGENNRNAPLVRNRHMLLRVYWQTQAGFNPRNIEARLTLDHGNGDTEVLTDVVAVNGQPNPNNINGTFSFILDPDQVTPGMDFSVALYETNDNGGGPASPPRFPANGLADLGVPSTRMRMSLTIVPYRVGNSNPNLDANAIASFREHFYSYNPIEHGTDGLRIRIYPQAQAAQSANVQNVLSSVCSLWNNDVGDGDVDQSEYYHAAVASQVGGGVLGVAYVLNSANGGQRCGANLWDPNLQQGPRTMTHEIGHNMGRPHAPCGGVSGSDPNFPYQGGTIGVQGWDPIENQLIANNATDYMGYCNNTWTSDYNYRRNAQRNADLQLNAVMAGPVPPSRMLLVGNAFDGDEPQWSVYRGLALDPGLRRSTTATVWTTEGRRFEVPLYEWELSEGAAVVAELPRDVSPQDVARVESRAFGRAHEAAPTILVR